MGAAFFWGLFGSAFLLLGAWLAYRFRLGRGVTAIVMALGSGVLFGSVVYELIDEALKTQTVGRVGLFMLLGAGAFAGGDWLINHHGGSERKDPTGKQATGSPLAIVMGSVLDGIPESFVLGLTVLEGGASLPLLAGIALSNLPESVSSSSGLKSAGWPARRVYLMWSAVVLVSGISALLGYVVLDPAGGRADRRPDPGVRRRRAAGDGRRRAPPRGVRRRRRPHRSAGGGRAGDLGDARRAVAASGPCRKSLCASRTHGTHLAALASLERRPVCLRDAALRCTHPEHAKRIDTSDPRH